MYSVSEAVSVAVRLAWTVQEYAPAGLVTSTESSTTSPLRVLLTVSCHDPSEVPLELLHCDVQETVYPAVSLVSSLVISSCIEPGTGAVTSEMSRLQLGDDVLAVQLLPLALAVTAVMAKPVIKPAATREPIAAMTVTRLVPCSIIASGEIRSPSSIREDSNLTSCHREIQRGHLGQDIPACWDGTEVDAAKSRGSARMSGGIPDGG